jgi:hypothetical protein
MFCKFILPEYGIRAMCKVILTYAQHRKADDGTNVDTISDIITRWAPPYENDTADYIKNVSEWSGVPADAVLDLRATWVLEALVRGITRQENGCMPYPDTVISAGVRMALNSTK